jgi:hypothetical protein
MSTIDGTWQIEIATPMGTQRFTLDLHTDGTALSGTATNNAGSYSVDGGEADADSATFSVAVASPFPVALAFALTFDGDAVSGTSKAGPFPPSVVSGVRV